MIPKTNSKNNLVDSKSFLVHKKNYQIRKQNRSFNYKFKMSNKAISLYKNSKGNLVRDIS
jgi:hypothetical protein